LIQFWAKGLTSDRTADYQIVGWPSDTSYLANPIVGGTEPASVSPHGTLIADGVISFNVGTPVTIHPVTGATETWYPGHDITETVADFCELIHTATASDTYDQAAIIKIDDLLMFDDIGIQFDAISNSEATVMAVAHLSW
jgi:hypothetical protein